MNIIDKINAKQLKKDIPEFRVGDTVKVGVKITVRKMSSGVGVERTFPIHSPNVDSITVVRRGKVRRAKLTFLRGLVGGYRIKERGQK